MNTHQRQSIMLITLYKIFPFLLNKSVLWGIKVSRFIFIDEETEASRC